MVKKSIFPPKKKKKTLPDAAGYVRQVKDQPLDGRKL